MNYPRDYLLKGKTQTKAVILALLLSGLTPLISGCEQALPEVDSPAAQLYVEKCGICHPPRHPQVHTYRAWKKVLTTMEKRVEESGIRPPLSKEETAAILAYLKKHGRTKF